MKELFAVGKCLDNNRFSVIQDCTTLLKLTRKVVVKFKGLNNDIQLTEDNEDYIKLQNITYELIGKPNTDRIKLFESKLRRKENKEMIHEINSLLKPLNIKNKQL